MPAYASDLDVSFLHALTRRYAEDPIQWIEDVAWFLCESTYLNAALEGKRPCSSFSLHPQDFKFLREPIFDLDDAYLAHQVALKNGRKWAPNSAPKSPKIDVLVATDPSIGGYSETSSLLDSVVPSAMPSAMPLSTIPPPLTFTLPPPPISPDPVLLSQLEVRFRLAQASLDLLQIKSDVQTEEPLYFGGLVGNPSIHSDLFQPLHLKQFVGRQIRAGFVEYFYGVRALLSSAHRAYFHALILPEYLNTGFLFWASTFSVYIFVLPTALVFFIVTLLFPTAAFLELLGDSVSTIPVWIWMLMGLHIVAIFIVVISFPLLSLLFYFKPPLIRKATASRWIIWVPDFVPPEIPRRAPQNDLIYEQWWRFYTIGTIICLSNKSLDFICRRIGGLPKPRFDRRQQPHLLVLAPTWIFKIFVSKNWKKKS